MQHQFAEAFADSTLSRAYIRTDSRICRRCGARAGQCEHLQAEPDIIWLSKSNEYRTSFAQWPIEERKRLLNLRSANLSNKQIAEVMNKTEGAVAGQLFRLRARQ